jgi:hypothetical protein
MTILNLTFIYIVKEIKVATHNRDISLKNWRSLTTAEGESYIDLVTSDFSSFRIHDTTINEVLISMQNKTNLKKGGEALVSTLSCIACAGSGTSDWISNICKSVPSKNNKMAIPEFERDNNIVFKVSYAARTPKGKMIEGYYSIANINPKLKGAIDLCSSCSGTGFLRFNNAIHNAKRYQIEKLGGN